MRYPIVIEAGSEITAYGVVVPDLPGCFSAGDTFDEAFENTRAAIASWIETALDASGTVPTPGKISDHAHYSEYAGMEWTHVDIDGTLLDDREDRVNVNVPRRILSSIVRYVLARGETRNRFLVKVALDRIAHGC
jgi:predicted RNase H-like HicB family nuclease